MPMDTLMTLDDVKQMALFRLLDTKMPNGLLYIAIDDNGQIYGYKIKPVKALKHGWWETSDEYSVDFTEGTNDSLFKYIIQLPDHISWEDCIWKI